MSIMDTSTDTIVTIIPRYTPGYLNTLCINSIPFGSILLAETVALTRKIITKTPATTIVDSILNINRTRAFDQITV